jgi:hypothetical protein
VEKLCGTEAAQRVKRGTRISINSLRGVTYKGESMPVSSLRNGKMIIKVSDVKDVVGDRFRISEEFYCELDREVHEMIERAARRAKRNGRKTLKPYDL